jgi:predicted GNAT superfamily acetyltransferase
VRALCAQTEYEEAVSLQEQIWGADVRETTPACVLQISQEVGGIAGGAFTPEGKLVGFVFGLTGIRNRMLAHWSHILAVEKGWRDRGVGRALKEHQREELLGIGVERMFWTFDPLESRNAHLNLNVLGATVESYVPHFYGETAVAATDTVIGTDRFVVTWNLRKPSVPAFSEDLALTEIPCVTVRPDSDALDSHAEPTVGSSDLLRVEAPADIQTLKVTNPEVAARWREMTRRALIHYLDAGYRVTKFRLEPEGRGGWYVLQAQH